MEIREAIDAGGKAIVYKYFDGISFPGNVPGDVKGHLQEVKNLSHKDGDVMVASFPKTGTHWAFEIIHMLTTGKAQYYNQTVIALDYISVKEHEKMEAPRVLVTHLLPKHTPKSFLEHKNKIVYVYRNPKDTAVSLYCFLKRLNAPGIKVYDGKWDDFIDIYWEHEMYTGWFQHVRTWTEFKNANPDCPILILSFEDMKKDLKNSVQKIAEFLGTKQDQDFLNEVTEKCQFSAMHKEKNDKQAGEKALSVDGNNPFYRKGDVGDWKNYFTVAQNERFDTKIQENMTGIDVPIQFTL